MYNEPWQNDAEHENQQQHEPHLSTNHCGEILPSDGKMNNSPASKADVSARWRSTAHEGASNRRLTCAVAVLFSLLVACRPDSTAPSNTVENQVSAVVSFGDVKPDQDILNYVRKYNVAVDGFMMYAAGLYGEEHGHGRSVTKNRISYGGIKL